MKPFKKNQVLIEITPKTKTKKLELELNLKLREIATSKKYKNVPAMLMQCMNWKTKKSDKQGNYFKFKGVNGATLIENNFDIKPLKFNV